MIAVLKAGSDDLDINRDLVTSILVRTLGAAGRLSGCGLEERLCVPYETIMDIVDELVDQRLIEVAGHVRDALQTGRPPRFNMNLQLSSAGRARAVELAATGTRYLGPLPISLGDYRGLVRRERADLNRIDSAAVAAALSELDLEPRVVEEIGCALSSRSSIFLYGPPGNGKSTITRCMTNLLGAPVEIPYAVAIDDSIIRVFDPVYHRLSGGSQPQDRRVRRVRRPLVRAGGELQLTQLELTYDHRNHYYESPLQWKANGGLLVIDDFGRQAEAPARLLNRFIVPMEEGVDFLDLAATGQKIELPFTCQLVFSTNLSPAQLVDEAFMRRIAYKVMVDSPDALAFGRILRSEGARNDLEVAPSVVNHLLRLYHERAVPLRGSHPKQLIARIVDRARYEGAAAVISFASIEQAFDAYLALGELHEQG